MNNWTKILMLGALGLTAYYIALTTLPQNLDIDDLTDEDWGL